jgi:DNA helicase-2/ATP-dependent DNA helicase PcrA
MHPVDANPSDLNDPIDPLDEDAKSVIGEEEALHALVRTSLENAMPRKQSQSTRARMTSIRGELGEAGADDLATLAAEASRIRLTAAVQDQIETPDPEQPYFAHMQLESDRGLRDILLGQCAYFDSKRGISIIDWRAAPVAQIFFQYEEGDDYEEDFPGRSVEGVVRKRRMLAFDRGELVQIQTPKVSLRRQSDGHWGGDPAGRSPRLEGGEGGSLVQQTIGTGLTGMKLPVVSSLLDAQQYEALTIEADRPLLIVGGAGCGKTTVALHRLAHLAYQRPDLYARDRMIVIVPEEGLVRLTRALLEELGMHEIAVSTVDNWFKEQAQRLFPQLPSRIADSAPASVIRLKRHPALAARLGQLATEAGQACAAEIDRQLPVASDFEAAYRQCEDAFPRQRLQAALQEVLGGRPEAETRKIREVFEQAMRNFNDPRVDRERLLGDRLLIQDVIDAADGDLPGSLLERYFARFRVQYSRTTDEQYADVAASRRRALDGQSLDAGSPDEDAGSIDVEDFALLLELHFQKTGQLTSDDGSLSTYTHMLLDEAQELSEVELKVLGHAVASTGTITVAGDPAQQIGVGSVFKNWDHTMQMLGQGQAAPVTLATSYRCTRPIVEFAHAVLGPLAPNEVPVTPRAGAPISRTELSNEMQLAIVLGDALSDLLSREPMARVAIIAREDGTAHSLYASLCQQLSVRLILDGQFTFRPGIDITSVAHVKGLEFDYVVIPDGGEQTYPSDPVSRRMLHVASTRAIHQLWLLSTGGWSTLIPL